MYVYGLIVYMLFIWTPNKHDFELIFSCIIYQQLNFLDFESILTIEFKMNSMLVGMQTSTAAMENSVEIS